MKKSEAQIDRWAKELAPSAGLRAWFGHDPDKWSEFKRRFFQELSGRGDALDALALQGRRRKVTLLFGAKEPRFNNAAALKQALESRSRR